MENYFITRKPQDQFLPEIVDYYFYIDEPVSHLSLKPEYIIPFPRISFGYFFDYPFKVTNLTLGESVDLNMAISRISTHKIMVQPQTNRIKIIGAPHFIHEVKRITGRSPNQLRKEIPHFRFLQF